MNAEGKAIRTLRVLLEIHYLPDGYRWELCTRDKSKGSRVTKWHRSSWGYSLVPMGQGGLATQYDKGIPAPVGGILAHIRHDLHCLQIGRKRKRKARNGS